MLSVQRPYRVLQGRSCPEGSLLPVPPAAICTLCFLPCRSLDRKLQRPLLGKSRTLPSIPQSPVLSRLPLLDSTAYREEMPEQKSYKKHSASDGQKGCTVPSAGECRGELSARSAWGPAKSYPTCPCSPGVRTAR